MEMTRDELVDTVARACVNVRMAQDKATLLVNAVADPKVTHVARGDWQAYGKSCPAQLAGLAPTQSVTFAHEFDHLTRASAVKAVQGRDPDDRERYIIRIV